MSASRSVRARWRRRVKAILKRVRPAVAQPAAAAPEVFHYDALRQQISYHGQVLALTRHELRLLHCLLQQPERVFSREQLLQASGVSAEAGYERTIDSHIRALRSKLRQVRDSSEAIHTHRGLGYSLRRRNERWRACPACRWGYASFWCTSCFVGLVGWFVLSTVMEEIAPGVRQSTEETLVDTANLLGRTAARRPA